MSTKDSFKTALATILTDQPLAYHPELARIAGGAASGVFLSQLLYWTPRGKLPDGWIWKSAKDWEHETGLTLTEQKRARKNLKERGILQEDLRGVPATLHYRIDLDVLADFLAGKQADEDTRDALRDNLGRFVSSNDDAPSLPETGKLVYRKPANLFTENRQTGLPETGKLVYRKPANQSAENRQTSLPETGALSIDYNRDYTENTQEISTEEEAASEVEAGARANNGADAPQPPPFLPNQFEMSVASLKKTKFTQEQCQAILAAEQSRGDAARVTLIRHLRQSLSEPPPAVEVFRATMGRYPPRNTWQSIAERIGSDERALDLWRELLEAWKLSSRNQTNYGWMLDCFDRGEIPGRKERRRATGEVDYTEYAHNDDLPPLDAPERTEAEKLWDSALFELELQMTRATFDTWLRGTRATGIRNGADGEPVPVLEVEVKNTYTVEWLENRLYGLIQRTLKRLTDDVGRVEFIALDDAPATESISQEILETNEVPAQ